MNRRTELTLAIVLLLAAGAFGFLLWGNTSGKFRIFGDTIILPETQPLAVTPKSTAGSATTAVLPYMYEERFRSDQFADYFATSGLWNVEANEATLVPGSRQGLIQSATITHVSAGKVSVSLDATADQPTGSVIYYYLSYDGGTTWTPILPFLPTTISLPKDLTPDWRWRALLERHDASRSPSISSLRLTFSEVK